MILIINPSTKFSTPHFLAFLVLKTNGRFTSFVRSFDAKRAFVLNETCVCFKRAIYTVRPAII